ncbi:hypothetical protein AQ610_28995 [Burkholderia humptydooensis]|nr:hypothetical protein AQ610_28995 [Burkholderia humptydooensis]
MVMTSMYAIVKDGIVDNTVLWDGDTETWQPPENTEAIPVEEGVSVSAGYSYSDGTFVPPSTE